jgi:hypothetical protein
MSKTIPIDERAKIVIEGENYTLQVRRQSNKRFSWRTDGYFPDLISLSTFYLNSSPQRCENAISSILELVQAIQEAEAKICRIIINNKFHGKNHEKRQAER